MNDWEWTITDETKFCVQSEAFVCGPFDRAADAHLYLADCKRNNPGVPWTVRVLHKPREVVFACRNTDIQEGE